MKRAIPLALPVILILCLGAFVTTCSSPESPPVGTELPATADADGDGVVDVPVPCMDGCGDDETSQPETFDAEVETDLPVCVCEPGVDCGKKDGCPDCGLCSPGYYCLNNGCVEEGTVGTPCTEDGDCTDGPCLDTEPSVCSEFCGDVCSLDGWVCLEQPGDPDTVFLCIPPCDDAPECGDACGFIDDGCGTFVPCGGCGDDQVCQDNLCQCEFVPCGDGCCADGETCVDGACALTCDPPCGTCQFCDGSECFDVVCEPGYHCENDECVWGALPCEPCTEDGDCAPGLTCPDGFCRDTIDATCDGCDDDGDGQLSEDYVPVTDCGEGVCQEDATPSICVDGIETPCQPGEPLADTDDTCDLVDDDCDGYTDEDYLQDASCGDGYCKQENTPSTCVDGDETPCVPGEPLGDEDAVCDAVDDDCDGYTDEDYLSDDTCGTGWCQINNTPSSCVDGEETPCEPGSPAPADTSCNWVDDDCDGETDDDYIVDASCGKGVCKLGNTPSSCVDGEETLCQPGQPIGEEDAVCDGLDDDCDGATDEDFLQDASCGVGYCQMENTPSTCVGGQESPCVPAEPLSDVDDTCDYIDDDCNGEIDEDGDPPCAAGAPVTGADVAFLATLGLPTGVVADNYNGTYEGAVVDLTDPNEAGEVSAACNGNVSDPQGFAVTAGEVEAVDLVVSRPEVCADDASVRACARATDDLGAPAADDTAVQIALDIGGETVTQTAASMGDGIFCAWLTTPGDIFYAGAAGSVTAEAAEIVSDPAPLDAAVIPDSLSIEVGEASLRLPLCARLAGSQFSAPVVVNTGDNELGSYNITCSFNGAVLEVLGVAKGAAAAMGDPVPSIEVGSVSFTAINTEVDGTAQGPAVEVAVISFKVRSTAGDGDSAVVSCEVKDLYNTNLVSILSNPVVQVYDGEGQGNEGYVDALTRAASGLFAVLTDNALIDMAGISGDAAVTMVQVMGLMNDGVLDDIADQPGTVCEVSDPAVGEAVGCVVTATGAGVTTVNAAAGGHADSTPLRVLGPELPAQVTLSDSELRYIPHIDRLQEARVRVIATFTDGDLYAFDLDVTEQSGFVSLVPAVAQVDDTGLVSGVGNGAATIVAVGALVDDLGDAAIQVQGSQDVTVTGVHVVVPATIKVTGLEPESVPDDLGEAATEATVTNLFDSDGQQVQASVLLVLSDDEETGRGSRIDITGWKDSEAGGATTFGSSDEAVVSVDENGVVTAVGSGDASVQVDFENSSTGAAEQGSAAVEVNLPPPQSVDLTVADPRLALSDADTAHLTLGLPVERQLGVVVHFVNGTSKDFTALPQTLYSVTGDLVSVTNYMDCIGVPGCSPGTAASTGLGTGTVTVTVTFPGTYLDVVTADLEIEVVSHDNLVLKSVEVYTAPGEEPAADQVLSWVECAPTRQQTRLIVEEVFTDGSVVDLSAYPGTTYGVYAVGTGVPDDSVITADPATDRAAAVGVGTVDLRAMNSGHASPALPMQVDNAHVDIISLQTTYAPGATFHGVRDTGTGQLDVVATAADGTRVLLTGSDFIDDLLVFVSDDPAAATVDQTGLMTAKGNAAVNMTIDLSNELDCGAEYQVAPGLALKVNLLPAEGDVDMGAPSGLAFPDQAADAVFDIPVRVNTGGADLGGIDLEITYDPAVIVPLDAVAGAALPGAIFNANLSTPGVIYLNASPALSAPVSGGGVEVAVITFQALKADGPQVTDIGGAVVGVVDLGGAVIGADTPRPIVAGAGQFDPPPGGVWGDANDDELFSIADVLFIQQIIVEPPLVVPNPTQLEQSDLFNDGVVASNDSFYASRNLARLTHFVDPVVEESQILDGHFDVTVVVTDRDQQPVDADVHVRLEVAVEENLGTITFTNTHALTDNGVITDAMPSGDGQYKTHVSGLVYQEILDVVVILDVLGPGGEVVATTAYLETSTVDPAATFAPLFEIPFLCQADCDGKACGADDGCGHYCDGPCPGENELCSEGSCVCGGVSCAGKVCGDDNGCGGLCSGPCPEENETCVSGQCQCTAGLCGGVCCASDEICEDDLCAPDPCEDPDCEGKACGEPDGCGGLCQGTCPEPNQICTEDYFCTCAGALCDGACCPLNHVCQNGECCQILSCAEEGWECGGHDVGCDTYLDCGDCGGVDIGVCTLDFQCDCAHEKCGGTCCGPLQGCNENDECFDICIPDCGGAWCGDGDGCDGACDGPCPGENEVCEQAQCQCAFEACESGCCPEYWTCDGGQCKEPCDPDCIGKFCGDDDGCDNPCIGICIGLNEVCVGGVCACGGEPCEDGCCAFGEVCEDGSCVPTGCVPQCDGAVCGEDDECGGLCQGTCAGDNEVCIYGQCQCAGEFCVDACCPAGQVCDDGACCVPLTCAQFGADACGTPQDGCGGFLVCGSCGEDEFCGDAFVCECEHDACDDVCCGEYEVCVSGACIEDCKPDCNNKNCGEGDLCGGLCDGPCPHDAQFCVAGVCFCGGTDCADKACGDDDGCGGPCQGPCPGENEDCVEGACACAGNDGEPCDGVCCPADHICDAGLCEPDCIPDCAEKACGDPDDCGGLCDGPCPGENEVCTDGFVCDCAGDPCAGECCPADHVCYQDTCCPIDTCEDVGHECGVHFAGCGTYVNCGDCGTWGSCDELFQCQCQEAECGGECCAPTELCVGDECTPPCVPDCTDKACGASDGCVGFCDGPCDGDYETCLEYECVCLNQACGDICCGPDQECINEVCTVMCVPACAGKQCGDWDGCPGGGLCGGPCPGENEYCLNGACVCVNGQAHCDGTCCGAGEICDQGACVPECPPQCEGKDCGEDDGCGWFCDGPCPGDNEVCVQGACQCAYEVCGGECCPEGDACDDEACCTPITCAAYGEIECGALPDGCGGLLDCGTCPENEICDSQHLCDCNNDVCGDACCAADETCEAGACVPACVPWCDDKDCGTPDGCGGLCDGPCPGENEYCYEGSCVCAGTDCLGKACGDPDGCSGICLGICLGDNEVCVAGECQCAFEICGPLCCPFSFVCKDGVCKEDCDIDCDGKACGEPDGCGSFCDGYCEGENTACSDQFVCECAGDYCDGGCCPAGHACFEGACCELDTCEEIGASCGWHDLGCDTVETCGVCGENEFCSTDDWACACSYTECFGACCAEGEACHPDEEVGCTTDCIPWCAGKECGADDLCGGLCDGPCPGENEVCEDGGCECIGLPCAGICCPEGQGCVDGECGVICIPECDEKECGEDDLCGGFCQGPCPGDNEFCSGGHCFCAGLTCGDACCAPGDTCEDGVCTQCIPASCGDLAADCGFLDDGCGASVYCGVCGPLQVCDEQHQCVCETIPCGYGCCPAGEICTDGVCGPCVSDCTGAACGEDDGCGVPCQGTCPGGNEVCIDASCECQFLSCGDQCCAADEACIEGVCDVCEPSCDGAACGDDDGCEGLCQGSCAGENEICMGGECVCGGVTCGDGCCTQNEVCLDGACACPGPLCSGACCGDDEVCHGGACCAPDCEGALCGAADGCAGFCQGTCPGMNETCEAGQCVCAHEVCEGACCAAGEICQVGQCTVCTPICVGASCGDPDGCGGICDGACDGENEVCLSEFGYCVCEFVNCEGVCCNEVEACIDGVCTTCLHDCTGKACGDDDGCGVPCDGPCPGDFETCNQAKVCECLYASCGPECCGEEQICTGGFCCTPDCDGKSCGQADGCGSPCQGPCDSWATCADGECVCDHLECFGECCAEGATCENGTCCLLQTCEELGAECGYAPTGCGNVQYCGACSPGRYCAPDFTCQCLFETCGDLCCDEGEVCEDGACVPGECIPDCQDKACGESDGCPGGVCLDGYCVSPWAECLNGTCACLYAVCLDDCCGPTETCESGVCCEVQTCEDLAAECGGIDDGCGNALDCGECPEDEECGEDNLCQCTYLECEGACCAAGEICENGACCTQVDCGVLGAECGLIDDGCGNPLFCGGCAEGEYCTGEHICACEFMECEGVCCDEGQGCVGGVCQDCEPDCNEKPCGAADGCGGFCDGDCGPNGFCQEGGCVCLFVECDGACCASGETCHAGACCAPLTCDDQDAECGNPGDGCGGSLFCGSCDQGLVCDDGTFTCGCEFLTCGDACCDADEICQDGACVCEHLECAGTCCAAGEDCVDGVCCTSVTCLDLGAECGTAPDGCGYLLDCGGCGDYEVCGPMLTCECEFTACAGACCQSGWYCVNGECSDCQPSCDGAACGDPDGCGGVCSGSCPSDLEVCEAGACVCAYVECAGVCCAPGEACEAGECTGDCFPDCSGKYCGDPDGCPGDGLCMGFCEGQNQVCVDYQCQCQFGDCLGECCGASEVCTDAGCCEPQFCDDVGAACGFMDDGCGQQLLCGSCGANQWCNLNQCECLWEACGGACCAEGVPCDGDECGCVSDCADKECGAADGCGGTCSGSCSGGFECLDFECVCPGLECEDQCCVDDEVCVDGECCAPVTCGDLGASCGTPPDGCGGTLDCGYCAVNAACDLLFQCYCLHAECTGICCADGEICADGACCAPQTCGDLDADCGTPSDGCGGTLDCGSCGVAGQCTDEFQCDCLHVECEGVCCQVGEGCVSGQCAPCTPDCAGKNCGVDDGCGSPCNGPCPGPYQECVTGACECLYTSCGDVCCAPGETSCDGGACCAPDCAGADCGDGDGCGGLCQGSCPGDKVCVEGACLCPFVECAGVCCESGQVCEAGLCEDCAPDCIGKNCGDFDGCFGVCTGTCPGDNETCLGGICVCQFLECAGACCAEFEACEAGQCVGCVPDCDGKNCGESDTCGGLCDGPCPGDYAVCDAGVCGCLYEPCEGICCPELNECVDGQCTPICVPDCDDEPCGAPDDCGGFCNAGYCEDENEVCIAGVCECTGVICEGACCASNETCTDGVCTCFPVCAGAPCGASDGCGGFCDGPCPENQICVDLVCQCEFTECGGECCAEDEICEGGQCTCVPDCFDENCGADDGCGGLCDGPCLDPDAVCVDGVCECPYTACGGECCAETEVCHQGACCAPPTCDDLAADCGAIDDGCGGSVFCGACGDNQWCTPDYACECLYASCGGGTTCCAEFEICQDDVCQCPTLVCDGECCAGGQVCGPEGCCNPATCGDLGAECGTPDDGCGGVVSCGGCGLFGECGVDFQCQCNFVECEGACCAPGEYCIAGVCTECTPDCAGKPCGADDGCEGLCIGDCPGDDEVCVEGVCECVYEACGETCCQDGEVCSDGACCLPACDGADCGDDDGCGGLCDGVCYGDNRICVEGLCQCAFVQCSGACCAEFEACEDGQCVGCTPLTCVDLGATCGAPLDGCGGVLSCGDCGVNEECGGGYQCECSYAECGGACCAMTETCAEGVCCQIDCDGKACGESDGCGGLCNGSCPGDNEVCVDGACDCAYQECQGVCCDFGAICHDGACCTGDCAGAACGDSDGCGGLCNGACPGDNETCVFGLCFCTYEACDDVCCGPGEACAQGVCCALQCAGAACGDDDGCGGLCDGTCAGDNEVCVGGACQCQYEACVDVCCAGGEVCDDGACCAPLACGDPGAECGDLDDGCGQMLSCGSCGANAECSVDHQCECLHVECEGVCCNPEETCEGGQCYYCVPNCLGKTCGDDDGCGGLCDGDCPEDQVCSGGVCVCEFAECAGACCAENEACEGGQCVCVPDCTEKPCGGADGCGGLCDGVCIGNADCVDGVCVCQDPECGGLCCEVGESCVDDVCCAAATCGDLGAECGLVDDGCGDQIYCGDCGLFQWCDPLNQCACLYEACLGACCDEAEVCADGACCAPLVCADLGATCGAPSDGCGGDLDCGECEGVEQCSPAFQCECPTIVCNGVCCDEGVTECDDIDGNCGGVTQDCDGKMCGDDDGYGGLCIGPCPNPNEVCNSGVCECEFTGCAGVCCAENEICEADQCVPCVPDCNGKNCGDDDGCGCLCDGPCTGDWEVCNAGVCECLYEACEGACCPEDYGCVDGQCEWICPPDCVGKACGEADGCGGFCNAGYCEVENEVCIEGTCVCAGIICEGACCASNETCEGGVCTCFTVCAGVPCGGDDGCGGLCDGDCPENQVCVDFACQCEFVECAGACCAEGEGCVDDACACVPDCNEMLCGQSDGCGGLCDGPCMGPGEVCVDFQCQCVGDTCGDTCCDLGQVCCGGQCCAAGLGCLDGQCCEPAVCEDFPEVECGTVEGVCGGPLFCGDCGVNQWCDEGACQCLYADCGGVCCGEDESCLDGACCQGATCAALGVECGVHPDGCGGWTACGDCGTDEFCTDEFECVCEFVTCGDDCCPEGEVCNEGVCGPCVPDCVGKYCGDEDGCGGVCDGICSDDLEICIAGVCECLYVECNGVCCGDGQTCEGGECSCSPGEEACGSICCPQGETCVADEVCVCIPDCPPEVACVEPDGCGGFCDGSCADPNAVCIPDDGQGCVCSRATCDGVCCGDDESCESGSCVPCDASCDGAACGDPSGCGYPCYGSCSGENEFCFIGSCECEFEDCAGLCCAENEGCVGGVCQLPCEPDCTGAECGDDDGCDGFCDGTCPDPVNQVCEDAACVCVYVECVGVCCDDGDECIDGVCGVCAPDCAGKLCGDADGCGGICDDSPCPDPATEICVDGICECLFVECLGTCCEDGQPCFGGGCCTPACDGAMCGDYDGCGGGCDGPCGDDKYICVGGQCTCAGVTCDGTCCEVGDVCQDDVCTCVPSCPPEAMCGDDDGCGGFCDGECVGDYMECQNFECVCVPNCDINLCGEDDGCGGICLDEGICPENQHCSGGNCYCSFDVCGGVCCDEGEVCDGDVCSVPCVPSCAPDGDCGEDDGCGEMCPGSCPLPGQLCLWDLGIGCQCPFAECSDACCDENSSCVAGQCVPCTPDCTDKDCGEDSGCGYDCDGACSDPNAACFMKSFCVCKFATCDDICCDAGEACDVDSKQCIPCTPDCAGKDCGEDSGCGYDCLGDCLDDNETCSPFGKCECEFVPCGDVCCADGESCVGGSCQ